MVSRALQEVANRAVSSQSSETVVPTAALKAVLREGEDSISKLVEQVKKLQIQNADLKDRLASARGSAEILRDQMKALVKKGR